MLKHPLPNQEMVSLVGCSNNKATTMWWQLGIHSWPTITLVNPKANQSPCFMEEATIWYFVQFEKKVLGFLNLSSDYFVNKVWSL
jgi:hypothetical protein